ncbi:uncharacterized protein LOC100168523 isoform X2 [Acyrthosiphon pisum]|uniref:Methyltransferase type 11 domain-containing protein n=1 Tax=Acyrthosiphon pisum TaxID=7029 RepID=A0A8R2AZX0_ACYPI|nr:uncharacterized protein LOC100168523 isoform X2 [Acyrthosiphon pisum]|eukprot:XP_008180540.1 PREDICTED: uncharacterized protein LOC100168523 isoform X2 [Acyrthosiphon pisum]
MDRADRLARSLELEKAYVHDTYQEMYQPAHKTKPWPKVTQFLHDLEPGSLVCDIGCGTGKYLSTNPHVFKVGVDRCLRLTEIARSRDSEVLVCDNLTLPFKDCSLDAVLSIAVIHHFSTTERRVCALRELARVLRIGGRIIITVWAMERRHRKFQSQDVLMPWHKPCRNLESESTEFSTTTTTSDEEYISTRKKSNSDSTTSIKMCCERKTKRKEQSNWRKGITSSPSSSSLSSPGTETCYSFVRKAIQLAGSTKRGKVSSKPWFVASWTSLELPSVLRSDPEGCETCNEDVLNVPIELRRMEDSPDSIPLFNRTPTHKSKSLTDIKNTAEKRMVRSRSSIPELEKSMPLTHSKPKLVKQKQSLCDEDAEEDRDKATDMKDLVNKLPQFDVGSGSKRYRYKSNEIKQRSMNEELMSIERLKEKEIVQKNIQRQASLNEELMYSTRTLESIKDTLQLLKTGFTKTFKNPSSQVSDNIKSGLSRMLGYKEGCEEKVSDEKKIEMPVPALVTTTCCDGRRSSREDGSSEDSSKDSLQSDASVDSEDSLSSLASVIFVNATGGSDKTCSPPLVEQQARTAPCTPTAKSQSQYRSSSHPNTPKTAPIHPSHFRLPTRFNSQNGNEPYQLNLSTEQQVDDVLKPIKLSPVKTAIEMKLRREQEKDQELERRDHVCEGGDHNARPKERISAEKLKQIQDLLLNTKPVTGRHRLPKADRTFSGLRGRHFIKTVEETFHPEIDDIDSDAESSSSDSVSSVISVVVEDERKITDVEFDESFDVETPAKPEDETSTERDNLEQICSSDSAVIKKDSNPKEYPSPKEDPSPIEHHSPKEDLSPKEDPSPIEDPSPKEDSNPKEDPSPKEDRSPKEDSSLNEEHNPKEDQPNHTNRWSLQEHPNKGTTVRNSPSLGSIPKHKRASKCSKDELSDLPETWDEECQKHLVDFAERLNKELRAAIGMEPVEDPKKARDDVVDTPEKVELMQYFHQLMRPDEILSDPSSSDGQLEDEPLDYHRIEILAGSEAPRRPSISVETQDSVDKVLRSREGFRSRLYRKSVDSAEDRHASLELECDSRRDTVSSSQVSLLRPGNSLESNDTADTHTTTQSTTSLTSWSDCSKDTRFADRRQARCDGRSSSEETDPRRAAVLVRQHAAVETQETSKSDDTCSLSTSQESLSEHGGGSITFHRYYHVFREGELDQLIEKHADNLHIISSYYDQSNWCVIAEKVQVWTI